MGDALVNRLLRYPAGLQGRLRIGWLRLLGAAIGKHCWIRSVRIPRNPWDIAIHDNCALDDDVVLLSSGERGDRPRIIVHEGTYVNRFTMLDAAERIEIGQNCMVGPHCYITDHDHGTRKGASIASQALVSAPVDIGADVWLGAGCIVLKGVTIGEGAVVGAGAVVTRNVMPYSRVAGVPARVIGQRD